MKNKSIKKFIIWTISLVFVLNLYPASLINPEKAKAATAGSVVINELMWMGSSISSFDEYLELRNLTSQSIDLNGWQLTKKSCGIETFMLTMPPGTSIQAKGYFLIADYDAANSILSNDADFIVGDGPTNDLDFDLADTQLQIKLYDGQWDGGGSLIDTADDDSGAPLAGDSTNKYSMERNFDPGDGSLSSNWHTAVTSIGFDLAATEQGTPKSGNKTETETPTFDIAISPDPAKAGQVEIVVNVSEKLAENPQISIKDSTNENINYSDPTLIGTTTYIYEVEITKRTGQGTATFNIAGMDTSFNQGNASQTFLVDSIAPQITDLIPADGTITNDPGSIPVISARITETGTGLASNPIMALNGNPVGSYNAATKTISASGPFSEGSYIVEVQATDLAGNPNSVTWTFEIDTSPPGDPGAPSASVEDSNVILSWMQVAGADHYEIWRAASGFELIATVASDQTSYTDTNVERGKSYQYKIVTVDRAGNKSSGALISINIPAPVIVFKLVPKAKAAPAVPAEEELPALEEIIVPPAEAEEVQPPSGVEEGKILGEEEGELRNWTPIIVLLSLLILFGAGYYGYKWYATKTPTDRW